jgi:hypothetical protein
MVHNWKIYDLKRTISTGVVTEVTYACESEENGMSARKIGEFSISGDPTDAGFIAYENLTEVDVLEWVYANVNKSIFQDANTTELQNAATARAAITEKNGTPW